MKLTILVIAFCLAVVSCETHVVYRGKVIDKMTGVGGLTVNKLIYFLTYNLNGGYIVSMQVSQNDYYSCEIGDSIKIGN